MTNLMTQVVTLADAEMLLGLSRRLASEAEKKEEFELGGKIAQIFSGCLFSALAIYLVTSNSTRLSFIHRASLEKRLSVCCQINIMVATISAFLNFFQVTEVDNFAVIDSQRGQFTVDTSRPSSGFSRAR